MNNKAINKENNSHTEHSFAVKNRSFISLCGIEEVISFEHDCIVMNTKLGSMTLDGSDLNVVLLDLDKGNVEIEGKISAVYYMEGKEHKRGLFSGLFG